MIWRPLRFPFWDYVWKIRKCCNSFVDWLKYLVKLCSIIIKITLVNKRTWAKCFFFLIHFLTSTCFVLLEVIFLFKFFSWSSKSVLFTKFACFNLAAKLSNISTFLLELFKLDDASFPVTVFSLLLLHNKTNLIQLLLFLKISVLQNIHSFILFLFCLYNYRSLGI